MTTKTPSVSCRPEWLFDDSPIPDPHGKGERAVKWLRRLKHPKSTLKGRAFQLDRWQERLIRRVYGDTHPDGTRKIKTLFALIPRGGRKTSLGAAMCMLHLGPERIPRSQVMSAAVDRDQARVAFEEMTGIISAHPDLEEAFQVQQSNDKSRITHKNTGAFYRAMSADAATAHGRTPVFALVDELHVWKKRDLWAAIRTGLAKTRGSLLAVITTAGIGQDNLAYSEYAYAKQVATGAVVDETFLPIIFEATEDDDWRDEAVWHRVNPGLSCNPPYPDLDGLRQFVREAEHKPADREEFKQFHLNMWLDGAAEPAWDMVQWDKNSAPADLSALEGQRAWVAVDLSTRRDLTAVAAAIELGDGRFALHVQSFTPEADIRKRSDEDHGEYARWRDDGWLTACPGNTIDLGMIEQHILMLCETLQVQELAFDQHRAQDLMKRLEDAGYPVVEFPQTIVHFAKPTNDFEELMFSERLAHGGNPLLRWSVGNTVLLTDSNNNRRPVKHKSRDRIDPVVASIMAVGRAVANSSIRSVYDNPDFDVNSLIF